MSETNSTKSASEKQKTKSDRAFTAAVIIIVLTVMLLFSIAVSYVVLSFFSNRQSDKRVTNDTMLTDQYIQIMDLAALSINKSAEEFEDSLNVISKSPEIIRLLDEDSNEAIEKVYELFEGYMDTYKEVLNIYIGTVDSKLYLYPKQVLPEGYDPTSRPWYKNAVNSRGITWGEPYLDIALREVLITLSIPEYDNSELVGVLSIDINMDSLMKEVKNIAFPQNGLIIIADQDGLIIKHPDKSIIGSLLPDGLRTLTAGADTEIIQHKNQGIEETVFYRKIEKLNLNLLGVKR